MGLTTSDFMKLQKDIKAWIAIREKLCNDNGMGHQYHVLFEYKFASTYCKWLTGTIFKAAFIWLTCLTFYGFMSWYGLPTYTINRHWATLAFIWSCVCVHLMNVSLIFTTSFSYYFFVFFFVYLSLFIENSCMLLETLLLLMVRKNCL